MEVSLLYSLSALGQGLSPLALWYCDMTRNRYLIFIPCSRHKISKNPWNFLNGRDEKSILVIHVAKSLHIQLFVTQWTTAHQAPLSLEFSIQEYWSGLPCPPPGDLPNPGIKPTSVMSPALAAGSLPLALPIVLYIFWILISYQIWLENIFSYSIGSLFTLLHWCFYFEVIQIYVFFSCCLWVSEWDLPYIYSKIIVVFFCWNKEKGLLVVQWLRFRISNPGITDWIPGWRTKILNAAEWLENKQQKN